MSELIRQTARDRLVSSHTKLNRKISVSEKSAQRFFVCNYPAVSMTLFRFGRINAIIGSVITMNQQKIQKLLESLPEDVTLVTVSKHHAKQKIDEVYQYGCRIFGENKVQELKEKYDPNYEWHMIGHLQRNKVKDVINLVSMIQSVDSLPLLKEIEKQCAKRDICMPILIEVNISREPNKYGILLHETEAFVEQCLLFPHVKLQGLMCVGPHSEDRSVIADCFHQMQQCFLTLKEKYGSECFRYLSMGMSDDYELALKYGSNMIRLGSIIMGERNY